MPREREPLAATRVVDGISYEATSEVVAPDPLTLEFGLTITNERGASVEIGLGGGCPYLPRAYRDPDRSPPPTWDAGSAWDCAGSLRIVEIPPGEHRRFSSTVASSEILADSLPDGRYFFSMVVDVTHDVLTDQESSLRLELAAGRGDLH